MSKSPTIPLIKPLFPGRDQIWKHFTKSLKSGQLSNFGPCYNEAVNRLSAIYCGSWIVSSSGASAIRLALQASTTRGSKVLIPDYTHVGTLNAVVAAGMVPVLGGCDRETWTLDEESIERASKVCSAMVVVSPFGYKVDFNRYDKLGEKYGLRVIYDLAGGFLMDTMRTKNICCYSLHATKSMPCGEGGLVVFNNTNEHEKAFRLMNFATGSDRMVKSVYGDNLKVSELTCAVLLGHLDNIQRIEKRIELRRDLINYYQYKLEKYCLPHNLHQDGAAPSLAVLAGLPASRLEQLGTIEGVIMRRYYIPLSEMTALSQVERLGKSSPYFRTCLALPSDATRKQANTVIKLIVDCANKVLK